MKYIFGTKSSLVLFIGMLCYTTVDVVLYYSRQDNMSKRHSENVLVNVNLVQDNFRSDTFEEKTFVMKKFALNDISKKQSKRVLDNIHLAQENFRAATIEETTNQNSGITLSDMSKKQPESVVDNVNPVRESIRKISFEKTTNPKDEFTYIAVFCHDRSTGSLEESKYLKQLITMLKSAAITATKTLRFHIVTNLERLQIDNSIKNITDSWPEEFRSKLQLYYKNVYYPPGTRVFQRMGRPCCTQRLFLPDMFTNMDAAIYIDLDVIFLRHPEELWDEFMWFDSLQLAAVGDSTFYKGKKIPHFSGGINPGIMMMNFTRMRRLTTTIPVKNMWTTAMTHIAIKNRRVRNDMDLLNVFFNMNPRLLYLLPCWWAFIKTFCDPRLFPCMAPMAAANRGVALIHGAGGMFDHSVAQRQFKVVFNAFDTYNFESSLESFYTELKQNLISSKQIPSRFCKDNNKMTEIMTLELERHIFKV